MANENIERAVGRMEGKIDTLIREYETSQDNWRKSFERLESVDRKVDAVADELSRVDGRLTNVEQPVAEFSKWRERAIGALMLISFASAAAGATIAALWEKVTGLFTG